MTISISIHVPGDLKMMEKHLDVLGNSPEKLLSGEPLKDVKVSGYYKDVDIWQYRNRHA
jgi:hypothetical protein